MDRQQLSDAVRLLSHPHELEKQRGKPVIGYQALAYLVSDICKRTKGSEKRQYDSIADQLPIIAQYLDIKDAGLDVSMPQSDRAARIEQVIKDMKSDKSRRMAPLFLRWMWDYHRLDAKQFLASIGYNRDLSGPLDVPNQTLSMVGIQGDSPYSLERVLGLARSRLILIAQNHGRMVMTDDEERSRYWPGLRNALLRRVNIDIVAMHPDVGPSGERRSEASDMFPFAEPWPSAIPVWAEYIHAPAFDRHVDHFWTIMEDWWELYRESASAAAGDIGRLRVFGAYFTPNTISVIDPNDSKSARLIISPRTSDAKSVSRPQFAIQCALEPHAYAYYYSEIEHAFAQPYWVKILG